MQAKGSRPSLNSGSRHDDTVQQVALNNFKRLWATNFLDDLLIEVRDVRYANGVRGKVLVYNMEERQRVKIVDYVGTMKVDTSKIEEALKEKATSIRLDSFIDPGLIRRVSGVVRDVYAEKGYEFVEVEPEIKEIAGGPKLVNVTFHITEGPKVKIRKVDFVGNGAVKDRRLARQMKENKGGGMFSLHSRQRHIQAGQVRRGCRQGRRVLSRSRLRRSSCRPARAEDPRRCEGRQDTVCRTADPHHRRGALSHRQAGVRGQQDRRRKGAASSVQGQGRGHLQREGDPQGFRQSEEKSTAAAGTWSSRDFRISLPRGDCAGQRCRTGPRLGSAGAPAAKPSGPPIVDVTLRFAGGQAVIRRPHHVRRQHHHPRSCDPPRNPARSRAVCSTRRH